jgi:DNA topoisomerase-2
MVKIKDFFNEDYITFAGYDNSRKINSAIDGLKTSMRKVFYTVLKNNIDSEQKEIKVEQLAAKTSEQTSYLHGAAGLGGVAVGLAVNYVGSNNINLLEPDGNFGTRFVKDPSASRYIYTYLSDIAKYIFRKEDEPILQEQTFEGQKIEPKYYYPIIPMVLVNGSEGLSVGFSSNINPRDPKQLIDWLEHKLKGKKYNKEFIPYFQGYNGTIERDLSVDNTIKYISKGKYIQDSLTQLTITEIPIKYNLKSYLKVLDTLCDKNVIKSYKDLSDNDNFKFEVRVKREFFDNKDENNVLSVLKLTESLSDNLVLLNETGTIQEFKSIEEILDLYYKVRLEAYNKRKSYNLNKLSNDLEILSQKFKFIKYVLSKKIKIDSPIVDIIKALEDFKFIKINDSYDYLLDMKISSLTKDKLDQLEKNIDKHKEEIEIIKNTTIEQMWLAELKELKTKL